MRDYFKSIYSVFVENPKYTVAQFCKDSKMSKEVAEVSIEVGRELTLRDKCKKVKQKQACKLRKKFLDNPF